jgi:hypothetical protein
MKPALRRRWPLLVFALGLLLMLAGFAYDVMCAGIPAQDPTPEMRRQYAANARIASTLCWAGAGAFVAGSPNGATCHPSEMPSTWSGVSSSQ